MKDCVLCDVRIENVHMILKMLRAGEALQQNLDVVTHSKHLTRREIRLYLKCLQQPVFL
jgi:hypothetical protein